MRNTIRLLFAVTCITCPFHALVVWAGLYLDQNISQPLWELSANALAAIWCALQIDKDTAAQEQQHGDS